MIVVSDAGPIIALSKIGEIDLLGEFFGRVLVPEAVHEEVALKGEGKPGSEEIYRDLFERRQVQNGVAVEVLEGELGSGEAEAIVLGRELEADLLVIDDKAGRTKARSIGLDVVGTLALLHRAVERGLIEQDIQSVARALRSKGVWFSDELVESLGD